MVNAINLAILSSIAFNKVLTYLKSTHIFIKYSHIYKVYIYIFINAKFNSNYSLHLITVFI